MLVCSHRLEELKASTYLVSTQMETADVLRLQAGNGMGQEDSQMIIEGMAQQGAEPTYCMGDDTPLPVLSNRPHVLYDYFKQRFAQVSASFPKYYVLQNESNASDEHTTQRTGQQLV